MPKSTKISPKVMYPCIFLAFYMSVRKLQGFITFHFLAFLEVFLKCYISLYLSYTHIEGKENTRICNFWWNVTYPCIFLALYMCVRKIQGYVTFHGKKVEKLHILVFFLHIIAAVNCVLAKAHLFRRILYKNVKALFQQLLLLLHTIYEVVVD